MSIHFEAAELQRVKAQLERENARVGVDVAKAITKAGKATQRAAWRNAPKRTGQLAAEIDLKIHGDGRSGSMTAVVVARTRYALFQERGTAKMAAQPFMAPAFSEVAPGLKGELARIAAKALS